MCNKTEFEVEGWRKIPPLIEILENHVLTKVPTMKLETIQIDPIISQEQLNNALNSPCDVQKLGLGSKRTIRSSWIYEHFKKSETKIAVYVNAVLPINQNLNSEQIESVGNHCVVIKRIKEWKNEKGESIECLELENNGGSEETKLIPVDHPFFEEVRVELRKIFNRGSDFHANGLNNYGKKLAEKKWGKLDPKWYDVKKKPKSTQKKVEKEQYKYQMLFVRAVHPCYRLKFTS